MRGKRITFILITIIAIVLLGGCIEENKTEDKNNKDDDFKTEKERMIYVGKGEKVNADTFLNITDTTTYKFKKKKDNKEIELEYNKLTWSIDDENKKKLDELKEGEIYTVEYRKDKLESVVIEDKQ